MRGLLMVVVAIVVGCSASTSEPQGPERPEAAYLGPVGGPDLMHFREVYHFDNLGEMIATSQAVIVGKVRAVEQGRVVTYDGGDTLTFTNVSIDVDEQLAGAPTGDHVTVELDDRFTGYAGTPQPKWLDADQTVLLFLTDEVPSATAYQPLNVQSIYRVDAGARVVSTNPEEHDDLSQQLGRMTFRELRDSVLALRARVEAGEIKPQRAGPPSTE